MQDEKKTDVQPSGTADEKETQKKPDAQTDEDAKKNGEDVGKQEENPYKAQLDKANEIIEKKNRAIEALKKAKKEGSKSKDQDGKGDENPGEADEASGEDAAVAKAVEAVKKMNDEQKLTELIDQFSDDPIEKELIKKVYDHQIVHSGDVNEDFKTSVAVVNRDAIMQQRQNEAYEHEQESFQVSSMSASGAPTKTPPQMSRVQREAAKLLTAMGHEKAIKHLNT